MSDEVDIELAKLKYADLQARRDFWKWFIMGIGLGLNALLPMVSNYVEHLYNVAATEKATAKLESKVDVVSGKQDAVAAKADENLKTGLKTNIAVNDWKASYTKDPMDSLHAEEARLKLESHGDAPAADAKK